MILKNDSELITTMRGILAILVVYVHIGARYSFFQYSSFSFLSGRGIANGVVLFVHLISELAVPTFFLMSGFLFFHKLKVWDTAIWKQKVKSRFFTLLIPYLIWNVIAVLCSEDILGNITNPRFLWDIIKWGDGTKNWCGFSAAGSGPQNVPLWYIRDLMGMVLLSPVIFFAIRKCGLVFLSVVFVIHASSTYPYCPGFGSIALFYFSLGAYFQLRHNSMSDTLARYKVTVILSFILLFFIVAFWGDAGIVKICINNTYIFVGSLFMLIIFGMFCNIGMGNNTVKTLTGLFSNASFLIFASHSMILGHVVDVMYKFMPGAGLVKYTPTFVFAPILTALMILAIYKVATLIIPQNILRVFGIR